MPSYYTYLISSLPALNFGVKAPITLGDFLKACRRLIPDNEMDILEMVSREGEYIEKENYPLTLKKWRTFDTALRNELVKIRASRRRMEPFKYLRKDGYTEPHISNLALAAYRNPSLLEAEKALDRERWCFLEGLETGHYFDIDFLIVYACKLLIVQKWEKIDAADKAGLLTEVLAEKG